jgi:hypothetical protein
MKRALVLFFGALAPLLYSNTLTLQGYFSGGSMEVYSAGSSYYCFLPAASSSAMWTLDTQEEACIYLVRGEIVAKSCGVDPVLSVSGLSDTLYKIVLASGTEEPYTLNVDYSGEFDRCTDYYQAGFLGVTIDQINFVLMLAGMLTAIGFFAAITYVILTLGNF